MAHHDPLTIKGQHLNRLGRQLPLHIFRTGLGIKGVKVLGGAIDDLLDLTLANAHGGFRFHVIGHFVKGHLGGLGGHPLLQPMRVTTGGEVQLRIAWKQAGHPALAIPGTRHTHRTKHTLIPGFHVIAFMRAHHPVRATHRVANAPRALVIQMILQQQPQQFAPIGFQIGLDVTVCLVAGHLSA